jgi:hypothetical protein
MTIDKATRGEGGMTAEIELSAKTSKPCRTRPGYLGEPFTKLFAAVATPARCCCSGAGHTTGLQASHRITTPCCYPAPAESATAAVGSGMPTATVQATSGSDQGSHGC